MPSLSAKILTHHGKKPFTKSSVNWTVTFLMSSSLLHICRYLQDGDLISAVNMNTLGDSVAILKCVQSRHRESNEISVSFHWCEMYFNFILQMVRNSCQVMQYCFEEMYLFFCVTSGLSYIKDCDITRNFHLMEEKKKSVTNEIIRLKRFYFLPVVV